MIKIGRKVSDKLTFSAFVIPAIIAITCMVYIPFLMNIFYSFTEWNGIQAKASFIGIGNFIEIFKDDTGFKNASMFTFKYGLIYIPLVNVLGIVLAVLLDQKIKTRNILRAVFFIPYILSLVVVGFVWKFIFLMGFESLYNVTGLEFLQLSWLGDSRLAFFSVVLVSVWQSVGFYIIVYIAGLQSIPEDILEASTIDGAGPITKFFKISLPMLMPSITTSIFMSLTASIKLFDVIVSLTGAGPGRATASIAYDIYTETFLNNRYGYGTAKAMVLFLVVLIITVVQVKFFKDKEVEV
jgi:raffinose/stachyose/melibiose transport system permease protein